MQGPLKVTAQEFIIEDFFHLNFGKGFAEIAEYDYHIHLPNAGVFFKNLGKY